MGVRDVWHRGLVYFGLAEDDLYYDDDEDEVTSHRTYDDRDRPRERDRDRDRAVERPVQRLDRRRRAALDEEAYVPDDEETGVVRRQRRTAVAERERDRGGYAGGLRAAEEPRNPRPAVKVHLIAPRSFNDAQQIADRFKNSVPVIVNLQAADPELAKRLIDFGSGLTYALDGGMQRIAEKVFLLTPRDVEVSAEDRARLVEQGFFNPA